jgi:IMP cyclohydrolase
MEARDIARRSFEDHIRNNRYPGRGLVIGRSSVEDAWLILYWIMGRSENSRNRRFVAEGTTLRTAPHDASKVKDPSLIIYEAMLELPGVYIASNGDQTRTIHDAIRAGGGFDEALMTREREPDAPNYTPRISGMVDLRPGRHPATLSILKANAMDPMKTDRHTYRPAAPAPGFGYCITTYEGDGNPLPPYVDDPRLMPCAGTAQEVLDAYWGALDAENRISLALKRVADAGGPGKILVRNRYGD